MMRFVIAALIATLAAPAWAEWAEVSWTETAIHYIDAARVRKDGNFRKVWQLQDLKQRHKDGEMSRRALVEIDCKEEQFRDLALSEHSEPMAGGETLWSHNGAGMWRAIPPDSVAEIILKIVCAK